MRNLSKGKYQKLKNSNLVDLRSPVQFRDGRVEGSKNLPLKNFLNALGGMKVDTVLVLIYDAESQNDANMAYEYCFRRGMENVFTVRFADITEY